MPNHSQLSADAVLQELASTEAGLAQAEAEHRLAQYGPNRLLAQVPINHWRLFFNQFKSFIVYILLVATFLAAITTEYVDATIILLILLANAGIGYWQELSAQKSLQALKQLDAGQAKVYRDGQLRTLGAEELVPGDVVMVEAGDKIPADARLLTANRLKVGEASLTGESVPVDKTTDALPGDLPIADRLNCIYAATNVADGSGKAVVIATGMTTEMGKIAAMLHEGETELTPLQLRLEAFGRNLGYVVLGICALMVGVFVVEQVVQHTFTWSGLLQICLLAVSLAVAAVPEGLPAVVTIALSIGVKKLLAKKALVKKLASVETLGSCNIICSDKTGTLTQNQMTVTDAWSLVGEAHLAGIGYQPEGEVSGQAGPLLFQIGALCNNASLYQKENQWQITGDPMEAALLASAQKAGADITGFQRLAELPFDSIRKRMSVAVQHGEETLLLVKGAPDVLLEQCDKAWQEEARPMDEATKAQIMQQVNHYTTQAKRVLGFAYKPLPSAEATALRPEDESQLIFVGLQALIDPPRPEVTEAVRRAQAAGIRLMMITGDHLVTAQAIGEQIGITGLAIDGPALDALSDDGLDQALANGTNLFARVTPAHKMRIIATLKKQQNVVAMTGDGVNDAPALQKADIGVAVGSGTDVAKEAADFVLMDDSFVHIVNAIEEGRGIYDNIQKAILHLLTGNLSEVIVVVVAVVLGWPLPLTAIMLLWINLVTDGMPALALAMDPHGPGIMERKPLPLNTGILPRELLIFLVILGVLSGGAAIALFVWYNGHVTDSPQIGTARTVVFQFIALAEMVILFAIRAYFRTPIFTNGWVWVAVGGTLTLQAGLMYSPLSTFFDIVPLGLSDLGILGGSTVAFGAVVWGVMLLLRAFPTPAPTPQSKISGPSIQAPA